jgi:Sulfotransferase family
MPFIVGSPRSGTTLLRFMLDAHSDLAIPPETGFVGHIAGNEKLAGLGPEELLRIMTNFPPAAPAWCDFGLAEETLRRTLLDLNPFSVAEGIRSFYQLYAARHGKRRVGDKTPSHGQAMIAIERLLSEAAFIHIIRDGRDSSLSLRDKWFAPSRDIAVLAAYWRDNVTQCRQRAVPFGAIWRYATKTFFAMRPGSSGGSAALSTYPSRLGCSPFTRRRRPCWPSIRGAWQWMAP